MTTHMDRVNDMINRRLDALINTEAMQVQIDITSAINAVADKHGLSMSAEEHRERTLLFSQEFVSTHRHAIQAEVLHRMAQRIMPSQ